MSWAVPLTRSAALWLVVAGCCGCSYSFDRPWYDTVPPTAPDTAKPPVPDVKPPPPDTGPADLPPPDVVPPDQAVEPPPPPGKWYQATDSHCPTFCEAIGKNNTDSPEVARCASGEVRPSSAIAQGIDLVYGCTGGCGSMDGPLYAESDEFFCYKAGQKRDDDITDVTVGCYCE